MDSRGRTIFVTDAHRDTNRRFIVRADEKLTAFVERQIASYTRLCPGAYSSGNTRLQSCVTKHGNPRLRAALVELAWRLVRFQPDYKPVRKWRQILAKGALATGAARKKAIVAVARQLAVDLWRIKTGRLRAEELGIIN